MAERLAMTESVHLLIDQGVAGVDDNEYRSPNQHPSYALFWLAFCRRPHISDEIMVPFLECTSRCYQQIVSEMKDE